MSAVEKSIISTAQAIIDQLPVSIVSIDADFAPPDGSILVNPSNKDPKWTPTDIKAMVVLAGIANQHPNIDDSSRAQAAKDQAMPILQKSNLWGIFASIGQGRTAAKESNAKLVAVIDTPEGLKFLAKPYENGKTVIVNLAAPKSNLPAKKKPDNNLETENLYFDYNA